MAALAAWATLAESEEVVGESHQTGRGGTAKLKSFTRNETK